MVIVADADEPGIEGADHLARALTEAGHRPKIVQPAMGKDAREWATAGATRAVVDTVIANVWALRFGPKHVTWVYGNGGSLELSDVAEQRILDANNNPFTAYVQELLAYPGLQVASLYSIGRIKKLTADSGKGLTNDLVAELLSKFPVGVRPDVFLMSRRSLRQLQDSRTATNATGAPAPFPTEAFGVPIAPTDAIRRSTSAAPGSGTCGHWPG